MNLLAHWCPRCEVQSETSWHLCKPAAPLFPQTAEETRCEKIEVVPAEQLEGAVDRAEKAEALVRRLVALMGDTAKELLPGELESSELLRRSGGQ